MIRQILYLTLGLFVPIILLAGCDEIKEKAEQQEQIDARQLQNNLDKPAPSGESSATGHWIGDKWHRTTQEKPAITYVQEAEFYTKNQDLLPPPLLKKLKKVQADGNRASTNPNYWQEVYDALCSDLEPGEAVTLLATYKIYTPVILPYMMTDYQAFNYLRYIDNDEDPTKEERTKEYAQCIVAQNPARPEALEAGIYVARSSKIKLEKESAYKTVLKYFPNSQSALFELALLILEDNPTEAIEYLNRAKYHPNQAVRYGELGYAYDKLGKHEKAIVLYKKALKLNLKLPNVHYFLTDLENGGQGAKEDIEAMQQATHLNKKGEENDDKMD